MGALKGWRRSRITSEASRAKVFQIPLQIPTSYSTKRRSPNLATVLHLPLHLFCLTCQVTRSTLRFWSGIVLQYRSNVRKHLSPPCQSRVITHGTLAQHPGGFSDLATVPRPRTSSVRFSTLSTVKAPHHPSRFMRPHHSSRLQ